MHATYKWLFARDSYAVVDAFFQIADSGRVCI